MTVTTRGGESAVNEMIGMDKKTQKNKKIVVVVVVEGRGVRDDQNGFVVVFIGPQKRFFPPSPLFWIARAMETEYQKWLAKAR